MAVPIEAASRSSYSDIKASPSAALTAPR